MADTAASQDQNGMELAAAEEDALDEAERLEQQGVDMGLYSLYRSRRPRVALVEGVPLSAIVNAAWLPADAKVCAWLRRVCGRRREEKSSPRRHAD